MFAVATHLEDLILRAGAIAGALGLIGALFAAVMRYSTKRFSESVHEIVAEKLTSIEARTEQLIPNGGSSLADAINRLEARQLEVVAEQRAQREALTTHLTNHRLDDIRRRAI